MQFDVHKEVAALRSDFPTLHDVDRAERVQPLLHHGISGRTLASELQVSEKLIRNLALISSASTHLKNQAREGSLSTRGLIRTLKKFKSVKKEQELARKQSVSKTATSKAGKEILQWLDREHVCPAYGEQVVDRAWEIISDCAAAKTLPKESAPSHLSTAQIIEKLRQAHVEDEVFVEYFAVWLARWIWFALGNTDSIYECFQIARTTLIRR